MSNLVWFRKVTVAIMVTVLVGVGLAPAKASAPLTLSDIYNPQKIVRADLSLPQASVDSLSNPITFKVYVPGTLSLSVSGKTSGNLTVTVRLKGSTSMYALNETPSFKIKFKKDAAGHGYLGLRRMTLNGMVQDSSKIHEYGAYSLFNAMGIPAPKTGWVQLFVNGIDRGLYVNIEQPDQTFMQKRFKDITQHIYEGVAFKDLKFGNDDGDAISGSFLVDYGWKATPNKRDLGKLIDYANDWDQASWYKGLTEVVDRTELIKAFAVEVFVGHWDSYSGPDINNYYFRSNTRGKFSYIPWGADQTFGENRKSEVLGDTFYLPFVSEKASQPWAKNLNRGKLYVQCVYYKPCRTEYLNDLKAVSTMATKINLAGKMQSISKIIDPTLRQQFANSPDDLALTRSEQKRSIAYIAKRQVEVQALLKRYGIK